MNRFRVTFTGLAREHFLAAVADARDEERGDALVRSMGILLRKLEEDARECGEPMYRVRSMKMMIRRAALVPIYIVYGVHESRPEVVINRVIGMAEPDSIF